MSILKYFRLVKKLETDQSRLPSSSLSEVQLPDPHGPLSSKILPEAIAMANATITEIVLESEGAATTRKKRGPYLYLTPVQHFQVGKRAAECGVTNTLRYYAKTFPDIPLKELTVRQLKNEYQSFLKGSQEDNNKDVEELPHKRLGRPLLLGDELDKQDQEYVRYLRERGTPVNTAIVIATTNGIVQSKNANLLNENGGSITLTKFWAHSLLSRMGMVKRKVYSKSKVTPENFESLKEQFLLDINQVVDLEEIPPELIINWDQTAIHYIPVLSWSMEVEGSKRVEVVGKDNKRQITACFAGSMASDFLPLQLVYEGKTTHCLPQVEFPGDWHITYSSTHWSNETTMKEYVDQIILPYITQKREELKLASNHASLLVFDNFTARCTEHLLTYIDSNNVYVVLIPPNCTDKLQPLDLSVNKPAKDFLLDKFQQWYSGIICCQFQGLQSKEPVDLRLAVVKPLGARWMISLYEYFKSKPEIIQHGFNFISNYLKSSSAL